MSPSYLDKIKDFANPNRRRQRKSKDDLLVRMSEAFENRRNRKSKDGLLRRMNDAYEARKKEIRGHLVEHSDELLKRMSDIVETSEDEFRKNLTGKMGIMPLPSYHQQNAYYLRSKESIKSLDDARIGLIKIKSLINDEYNMRHEVEFLMRQIKNLESSIAKEKYQVKEWESLIPMAWEGFRDDFLSLSKAHKFLIQELNDLSEEKNEVIRDMQNESAGLRSDLRKLLKDQEIVKQEKLRASNEYQTLSVNHQELLLKYESLVNSLNEESSSKQSVDRADYELLSDSHNSLKSEISQLIKDRELVKQKLRELLKSNASLNDRCLRYSNDLRSLKAEHEKLKDKHLNDLSSTTEEKDSLMNNSLNEESSSKQSVDRADYELLSDSHNSLKSEISQLIKEREGIKEELRELTKSNASLNDRYLRQSNDYVSLRADFQKLQDKHMNDLSLIKKERDLIDKEKYALNSDYQQLLLKHNSFIDSLNDESSSKQLVNRADYKLLSDSYNSSKSEISQLIKEREY